jgi:hypothetical protein
MLNVEGKEALKNTVERFPDTFDEEEPDVVALGRSMVRLRLEDYAGNFVLPSFEIVVPGSDYYASNMHLLTFVIADSSTNQQFVYCYDEQGMGKDCDALCSLRTYHNLKPGQRDSNVRKLFQVVDNNVGQNKSQVLLYLNFYKYNLYFSFAFCFKF